MIRVLSIVGCVALASVLWMCATTVTIPVVTKMPTKINRMMEGKRNVGVIAVKSEKDFLQKLGLKEDWTKTVQGGVINALEKWGYYRLVDLESKRERLEQLAYSRSGMTQNIQAVGQELNADAIVFVDMTNQPRQECKVEMRTDLLAAGLAIAAAAQGQSSNQQTKKPTGVLYLTVFVRGRLVRTTTGEMKSYQNKDPIQIENSVGSQSCPSTLKAFGKAMEVAGTRIADEISPKVQNIAIPIATDPVGAPDNLAKRVEAYLEQGVKWIKNKPPNFERAKDSFNRALEDSGQKSASALWNLAVVRWAEGDMDGADEFFKRAERAGGPEWLGDDKIKVINRFAAEKKRKEKEGDAE